MGEIGAARAKFLRASSPRLAKKKGTQFLPGCLFVLCEGASSVLWRLALPRKSGLPVYIAPCGEPCRREGNFMSDFELLSIVLMILAIIVTLMVELFKSMKK